MRRKGAVECFASKPAPMMGWMKSGLWGVIRRHSCTDPEPQIYICPKHRCLRTEPIPLEEKSSRTGIQVLENPEAFAGATRCTEVFRN